MRIRTEETRRMITEAALSTFCSRGYGVATLEEIGAEVGLTRGAVLHHFVSKADLLSAVFSPYRLALADLLLNTEVDDPPTKRQRRELLVGFADLFLAHRGALRLLASDVSARVQLGLGDQWPMPQGQPREMPTRGFTTSLRRPPGLWRQGGWERASAMD